MATPEDLEAYLTRLDRKYERLPEGTYLVSLGPGQPPAALRVVPPVLVVQVEVGPEPTEDTKASAALFRKLLQLNAADLLHVAYAIESGRIVLTSALAIENLDLNEIEAVLSNIDMSIALHVPTLRDMARNG